MRWRTVRLPECDDDVSERCRQEYADIVKASDALTAKRLDIESRTAKVQGVMMSAAVIKEIDDLRFARVSVIQDEIDLRERFASWSVAFGEELRPLTDVVFQAKLRAEDAVQAQLVAIGYVPYAEHRDTPNRCEQQWLWRHPSVQEREARVRQVGGRFQLNHSMATANDVEIRDARQELEGFRTSLSTV